MNVPELMRLYKKARRVDDGRAIHKGGTHQPDKRRMMMLCVIAIGSPAITECDSLPHHLAGSEMVKDVESHVR